MDGNAQFIFHMMVNNLNLYIFVNKNYEEMKEIFHKPNIPVMRETDKVKILRKSNNVYQRLRDESMA